MSKKIKVAQSWWSKWDENQQRAFIDLAERSKWFSVNDTRKFISSAKKRFGTTDLVYCLGAKVKFNGEMYLYARERDDWVKL